MFGVLLSCKIFYGISFKVAITNDMSIKKVYIIVKGSIFLLNIYKCVD